MKKMVQECVHMCTPYMIVFAGKIFNAGDADCDETPVADDDDGARICFRMHTVHDCVVGVGGIAGPADCDVAT